MTTALQPIQSLDAWQLQEIEHCRSDFWYFAETYVKVMDKAANRYIPFRPYDAQRRIGDMLLAGEWPWVVKARRLGATVVVLAFILWRSLFYAHYTTDIVSQKLPTAQKLLTMYLQLEERLPAWMRPARSKDNTTDIVYEGVGSAVRVMVGSEKAARSEGIDLLLVDEAAFVDYLEATLSAAEPALETSNGICCVVSTSDGAGNDFHAGYMGAKAGRTKYQPVFLGWWERPGRDQAWYDHEEETHRAVFGHMQKEYPRDDIECFEMSGDRVFAGFSRDKHFAHCEPSDGVLRYRAIDFGNTVHHPFVCIWLWHDPLADPRLTFETDEGCEHIMCSDSAYGQHPEGSEQMFAYRRDPKTGALIKMHDDLPDALRYVVTMEDLIGHVHVYRILSIRCDDGFQMSPLDMFKEVQLLSGMELMDPERNLWKPGDAVEHYAATVCDRSGTGWIRAMREQHAPYGFAMDVVAYEKPERFTKDEREQGIIWLHSLILGKSPWEVGEHLTDRARDYRRFLAGDRPRDMNEQARHLRWRSSKRKRRTALWGYA